MESKKKYKSLNYYLSLPWTYTVEQVSDKDKNKITVSKLNRYKDINQANKDIFSGLSLFPFE